MDDAVFREGAIALDTVPHFRLENEPLAWETRGK
jgi:hypothetical protein